MEIQSAFNSGVQGFQRATEAADQAAADIAVSTSISYEADAVSQAPASNEQDIPDLNQSIVELKVAEYQAKASTEVIQAADDNLGTLLDVTA